jgi:hypothetical protein
VGAKNCGANQSAQIRLFQRSSAADHPRKSACYRANQRLTLGSGRDLAVGDDVLLIGNNDKEEYSI